MQPGRAQPPNNHSMTPLVDRAIVGMEDAFLYDGSQGLGDRRGDALMRISSVALNLSTAELGCALGHDLCDPDGTVHPMLQAPRQAIAHLAILGAINGVIAAIDTCADIVAIVGGRSVALTARTVTLQELSVQLRTDKAMRLKTPIPLIGWAEAWSRHPVWLATLAWRHAVIHRDYRPGPEFVFAERSSLLIETWRIFVSCGPELPHQFFQFPDSLREIVNSGVEAVVQFADALSMAYPHHTG